MKKFLKFVWNTVKHIFLFQLYCSMANKYNGVAYEEWLRGKSGRG